jgi:adenosylhomocysteine nucleosidase
MLALEWRARHHGSMPSPPAHAGAAFGVLCALPEELGPLADLPAERQLLAGVELRRLELAGSSTLAAVGGVGKARAAQAAAALIAAGAVRGLLVVGVAGALSQALAPGELVHCTRAVQADLAVRHDREFEPDAGLLAAWSALVPGSSGWFLTADRPVLSRWRRWRLRRAFRGPCVADMETAAAAAVATSAGVPWAALRAVTDRATEGALLDFKKHFPAQAGRAASTVSALLAALPER